MRVAAIPSKSGIFISIKTILGCSVPALTTASSPVIDSPTMSTFGKAWRIVRNDWRTSGWSSARSTRIGLAIVMGASIADGKDDFHTPYVLPREKPTEQVAATQRLYRSICNGFFLT